MAQELPPDAHRFSNVASNSALASDRRPTRSNLIPDASPRMRSAGVPG